MSNLTDWGGQKQANLIIVDMGEWRVIVDLGQNQYCILSIGPIKVTLFKKNEKNHEKFLLPPIL